MRVLRAISLPKEADYASSNEDFFLADPGGRIASMSDGASESFDSRNWARCLCQTFNERFLDSGDAIPSDDEIHEMVSTARDRFLELFSSRDLSWSQQVAFDRGNFASLIGVIESDDQVTMVGIGDSIAIWQETSGRLQSHPIPIDQPDSFKRHPVLLSSDARGDEDVFHRQRRRWSVIQVSKSNLLGARLYLMTDALGHQIVSTAHAGHWDLAEKSLCQSETDFRYWVTQQRLSHRMRVDDTTLAVLSFKEPR